MGGDITSRSDKIVVLYGGVSAERQVSLVSGENVIAALHDLDYAVVALDTADAAWQQTLLAINPCYVFIALHGSGGEDGLLQGFLSTYGFSYSGSGVLASALAMDKSLCKSVWLQQGLPTLDFMILPNILPKTLLQIKQRFSAPYCLKTVNGGSSIGIERVVCDEDLVAAYERLAKLGGNIILEPWIYGREYTVGIMNGEALPVIEIAVSEGFYDYKAKYERADTDYICPCDLDAAVASEVQRISLAAFNALGCSHWGRVDLICDKSNNFYLLEVNTIPGMTNKSLVPMAAKAIGYSFRDFVLALLPRYLQKNTS